MARVGLSYPRYAKYKNTGGTVTYEGGGSLGKAISMSIDLDDADSDVLYADNSPAESVSTFAGGTVHIGTDDLYDDAAVDVLGWEKRSITTPEATEEIIRKAETVTPYIGTGGIIKHIRSGATAWTAMILTKTQFADPGLDVKTQGETIEWQTPELKGTILRDDTPEAVWCRHATFTTEAYAKAYIDSILTPADAE